MPTGTSSIKFLTNLLAYQTAAQNAAASNSQALYWHAFKVGQQFKPSLTLAQHEATVRSYVA